MRLRRESEDSDMQSRRNLLAEISISRIGEIVRPANRGITEPSCRAHNGLARRNHLLRWRRFPWLPPGRWRSLGLSLALVFLQVVTPHQGQAQSKAMADSLTGESVDTSTNPQSMVSAGGRHTCSVRSDGTLACWGNNDYGQVTPPSGAFHQVSAGADHTCGIKDDGTLACWGIPTGPVVPPGAFRQLSAGEAYTCGVRVDDTLACWGAESDGRATPPNGLFSQVSARSRHTCGLRIDGTLACWGNNDYGQLNHIPTDTFIQVSVGMLHTCALRQDDHTLTCWGNNDYGQLDHIPSGTFTQVSIGSVFSCGIKTDGTLACWGDNVNWPPTPPDGTFSQVSAGFGHTCGVRTDGTLACWGNNDFGQAPVLSLNPSSLGNGLVNNGYSQSFSLTDAVYIPALPQTFILAAGSLPPGLTLSATGLLSGTPTSSGTFFFTVYGEDTNGLTATQDYDLTINGSDTTPPVITPSVSGTLGNNGWYKSNVSVSWSVVDSESTVTTQTGCGPQTVSTDTTGVTFTCQATSAGGTTSRSVTIKRDATAPILSPTVSPNPVLLNGTATATSGASDAMSGLAAASCNPVATSNAGNFTLACTATDSAGNVTNASASYVVKYQFLGFLSPLPGESYRPGATIQVKFRLGDAAGTPIADATAQSLAAACRVKVGLDTAAGCASYDARNDLFQLSVKVPKTTSVGTHQIVMEARASDNTLVNTATTAVTIR